MSTPRKLGVAFCVLGFIAVCVLAIVMPTTGPFAGLAGIQSNLAGQAEDVVTAQAPTSQIKVKGRELTVTLPPTVPAGFDRSSLQRQLDQIDGLRSVRLVGDPQIALEPGDAPAPAPTEAPEPDPAPEPTASPEPDPEPTQAPEPEPTPAPEPTEPDAAPTLEGVLADIDTGAVDFEPGTAVLTAADTALLDVVADQLAGLSGGPIEVQAHTDNVGDPDVNLLLSQDRAEAVIDYLIERGVDAALLTPRGYGASAPIADNSTEQGRADNQRVVFVVEGN